MKFEDIFFSKGGKKHPGTDSLPLLEDVFEINTINIKFEDNSDNLSYKKKQLNQKNINRDKFVSNEMGTTANIMLIKNGIIYIANVGDSLSVMYKNRKAYNLNKEHQIIIDSEKERVLKSGATIVGYRINGMLNLTRAIGDLKFKSNQNLKRHEQSVIAVPEITKIEYTDDIDFIIMGCDGVWDCVKRQMVCDFVDKQIRENPDKDLSEILKLIFDRCVSPVWGVVLGTDNMSCIIIQFLKDGDNDENNIIARKINFGESVEELEKENILQN
jgi:serine/threonine protein phosphatase PrpC